MKNKKKIIIIVVVAIVILLIGLSIKNTLGENEKSNGGTVGFKGPKDGILVTVGKTETHDIVNTVSADGEVDMVNKGFVYSPSSAVVSTVNFEVGDTVKKGDILLTFKDDSLETLYDQLELAKLDLKAGQLALDSITIPNSDDQILQLESQLRGKTDAITMAEKQVEQIDLQIESATQQLNQAKDKLADGKILYENDIMSRKDYEALEEGIFSIENNIKALQLDRVKAVDSITSARMSYSDTEEQIKIIKNKNSSKSVINQVDSQKIVIEKLNLNVQFLEEQINEFEQNVVAEHEGTILVKNVDVGTTTQKGETLFAIGSTGKENLVIKVNVLEYDSGDIEVGQEAIIEGDSLGNKKISGKISKIYPTVEEKIIGNSQKKVVVAEIEVDDTDFTIRAGSTVEANITISIDENTIVAPLMSIFTDADGEDYIFVVNDDFTFNKVQVELGTYTGSGVAVNNISESDIIITNPTTLLNDGGYVKYSDLDIEDK